MNELQMMLASATKDANAWIEGFAAYNHLTATGAVGATLIELDDEHATLEMTISNASRQPFGLLHGGVSLMLAESASSLHSAWLADLSQVAPVGVDINGTHISSARDGVVHTTARVIRETRSMIFHEVDVVHVETQRVLCKCRVTNFLKPHR